MSRERPLPHETPQFQNAAEYVVAITYTVAGGARRRTAERRAERVAERLANAAARAADVVEVSAVTGPTSSDGTMLIPRRVHFAAANSGQATYGDPHKLDRYLDPTTSARSRLCGKPTGRTGRDWRRIASAVKRSAAPTPTASGCPATAGPATASTAVPTTTWPPASWPPRARTGSPRPAACAAPQLLPAGAACATATCRSSSSTATPTPCSASPTPPVTGSGDDDAQPIRPGSPITTPSGTSSCGHHMPGSRRHAGTRATSPACRNLLHPSVRRTAPTTSRPLAFRGGQSLVCSRP